MWKLRNDRDTLGFRRDKYDVKGWTGVYLSDISDYEWARVHAFSEAHKGDVALKRRLNTAQTDYEEVWITIMHATAYFKTVELADEFMEVMRGLKQRTTWFRIKRGAFSKRKLLDTTDFNYHIHKIDDYNGPHPEVYLSCDSSENGALAKLLFT